MRTSVKKNKNKNRSEWHVFVYSVFNDDLYVSILFCVRRVWGREEKIFTHSHTIQFLRFGLCFLCLGWQKQFKWYSVCDIFVPIFRVRWKNIFTFYNDKFHTTQRNSWPSSIPRWWKHSRNDNKSSEKLKMTTNAKVEGNIMTRSMSWNTYITINLCLKS